MPTQWEPSVITGLYNAYTFTVHSMQNVSIQLLAGRHTSGITIFPSHDILPTILMAVTEMFIIVGEKPLISGGRVQGINYFYDLLVETSHNSAHRECS